MNSPITINALGANVNLQLRQGNGFAFSGIATNGDGTPVNLTGKTVSAVVWRRTAGVVAPGMALQVTITDALNGKYDVSFLPAITTSFLANDFFKANQLYAYKVTLSDGLMPQTLLYGTVDVAAEGA